jgi:hypothetical protein
VGRWTPGENGTDTGDTGAILTGTVNLWDDTAYVDPDNGDYCIGPGSGAVDAGVDVGVTSHIDGEPRPYDGDGDGIDEFDIGADEWAGE